MNQERRDIIQANRRVLKAARRKLGWRSVKKSLVFKQVALIFGVPQPGTVERGYALLRQYVGTKRIPKAVPGQQTVSAPVSPSTDAFLQSYAWRRLRMVVLKKRGAICECCGSSPKNGVRIHVDHIKPRKLFPDLALEETNLQVLCEVCNHGKGNWDQTDWRADTTRVQ